MSLDFGDEDLEVIPGYLYATCGEAKLTPEVFLELHHGASAEVEPAFVASKGLPLRGNDIDLARHADQPAGYKSTDSAFRGTVPFPAYPGFTNGAVHWAGSGGLVFEIHQWRGYDLTKLEGRISTVAGHRSSLMQEQEIAIPARVPKRYVARIADVKENIRGQLIPVWRRGP